MKLEGKWIWSPNAIGFVKEQLELNGTPVFIASTLSRDTMEAMYDEIITFHEMCKFRFFDTREALEKYAKS